MTEQPDDEATGFDELGEVPGTEQVLPPEAPPMDDAAGGPQADPDDDTLKVQGGDA